jgi:hypothetical protein
MAAMIVGTRVVVYLPGVASGSQPFSQIDDFDVQFRELVAYIENDHRPRQFAQVDLSTYRKVSQYTDIDSSPAGYGKNACGPVAAAAALGGDDWVPLVAVIVKAAGEHYQPTTGIQPAYYAVALQQVFGAANVRSIDQGTLGDLYRELADGNVVIVDVKVNDVQKAPSPQPPNLAHFARVLGIDVDRRVIYLENTLRGDAYWTISVSDFWGAWQRPETSASIILDRRHAEEVTRWAVVISGELVPAKRTG